MRIRIEPPTTEVIQLLDKGYHNLDTNEVARLKELVVETFNLNWEEFKKRAIDKNFDDIMFEGRSGGRSTCGTCVPSLSDPSILSNDYRSFTNPHYVHLPGYTGNPNFVSDTTSEFVTRRIRVGDAIMFPVWPFRTYTVETSNCDPGIDACLAVWRQQFDASQNFIGYVSFSGNYSSSNLDFGEGSQTSNERVSFNTAWDNMDFSSNHYVAKLFHQIESNNQFVCDYTSNLECDISVRVENCQNDVGLWGSPVENC